MPAMTTRPCLELVATVSGREGNSPHDRLSDPRAAVEWLATIGLPTRQPLSATELDDLRSLREAIYRLLAIRTDLIPADHAEAYVRRVNRWAKEELPAPQLRVMHGELDTTAAAPAARARLALLARDAIDLVTGPDADLLHQCEQEQCGTFFLDTSPSHRRRWCSSASCGNRARVSAYRARRN